LCVWNKKKKILVEAFVRPQLKFLGNAVESAIEGHKKISRKITGKKLVSKGTLIGHVFDHDEVFEMTYPKYFVKGLIIGSLQMELGGKSTVKCEKSGFFAEVEFKNAVN
jgi:oxysterol-binding protein-related protein 8